ncbi:MAG: hypothetical protein J6Z04_08040 [Clostridia bacterium]|nr:hypothetical protein [Clostridia bacterium]
MKPNETPEQRKKPIEEFPGAVPATDVPRTPEVPDPPVPNRAWTEMKLGRDVDDLTPEERSDLYIGRDRPV